MKQCPQSMQASKSLSHPVSAGLSFFSREGHGMSIALNTLNTALMRIGATKTADTYPVDGEKLTTIEVWAPPGRQWLATSCRVITAQFWTQDASDKADCLQALIGDVEMGTEELENDN